LDGASKTKVYNAIHVHVPQGIRNSVIPSPAATKLSAEITRGASCPNPWTKAGRAHAIIVTSWSPLPTGRKEQMFRGQVASTKACFQQSYRAEQVGVALGSATSIDSSSNVTNDEPFLISGCARMRQRQSVRFAACRQFVGEALSIQRTDTSG
jgi:hypothetical protein